MFALFVGMPRWLVELVFVAVAAIGIHVGYTVLAARHRRNLNVGEPLIPQTQQAVQPVVAKPPSNRLASNLDKPSKKSKQLQSNPCQSSALIIGGSFANNETAVKTTGAGTCLTTNGTTWSGNKTGVDMENGK